MGLAVSSSGTTYVVALYSPPGNLVGQSPAQGTNGVQPTQGKRRRPGQQASGGARRPIHSRQHWPGQRDSPMHHGDHQSPWPFQSHPPGSNGNLLPGAYSPPPPQSGILGPHEFNRWLTDPHLRYSPYNPLGPLVNPGIHQASATHSTSTGCCIIL